MSEKTFLVLLIFSMFFVYALQTTSSALKGAIQLSITHTVGSLSQKPERDVLLQDFEVVESIFFPRWFLFLKWWSTDFRRRFNIGFTSCVCSTWIGLHIVWFNPLLPLSFCGSEGSNLTPAHHYGDFRFKTYAPVAFRYFREMFGIRPDDYMVFLFSQQLFKTYEELIKL